MNNEDLNQADDQNMDMMMLEFFGKGGTLRELKDMSDDSMEAIYSVAYNLYQSGKYDEAQKIFQFLCFYDHLNRKYFMGLGACQQMMKKYEQAIEIFSFASLLDSDDPRPILYMGDCHLAMGNKDNAKAAYEKTIKECEGKGEYSDDKARAENMLENLD